MPCYLAVYVPHGGAALAERVSMPLTKFASKGDPLRGGGLHEADFIQFYVSRASFKDLPSQLDDAAAYLAEHAADIAMLAAAGEVVLDFGYEPRASIGGMQSDTLPPDLVRRAATLGVKIQLSLYLIETY